MAKEKREYVWLECSSCHHKNYRTSRKMNDGTRKQLRKYCKWERKHTIHNESRKK